MDLIERYEAAIGELLLDIKGLTDPKVVRSLSKAIGDLQYARRSEVELQRQIAFEKQSASVFDKQSASLED